MRWTDRRLLLCLLAVTTAVNIATVTSRYQTAVWAGRVPLPTFLAGDGPQYRAALLSMLEDRDLDLRNQFEALGYTPHGQVSLGSGGVWRPKPPIVLPALSMPWFAVAGDAGLLAFNVAQLEALVILMWILACRTASGWAAAIAVVVFSIGTLLRPAAYNWSPDVLSTVLTLASLAALLWHRPLASGLLLGAAVWAKLPNLAFVPVIAAYAMVSLNRSQVTRFALGTAAGLIAIALSNLWMFGSPIVTGYDRVIVAIVDGQAVLEPSHWSRFDVPIAAGVWRQLTSPKGLLMSAPPLLAAWLGLFALRRRDPHVTWLIAGLTVFQIASFAAYRDWDQSNFGHRFLITTVALGVVPFAALLDSLVPSRPS